MPVSRPLPVILSILFALGIWTYGALRLQTDGVIRGGYATLVLAESYPDEEIRGCLDGQGLRGLVSESDQWALLDCFGGVEKIPLVEYSQRLFPFDPRNDGYAEKLRNVFVRDGKRFIYIPLDTNHPEDLEIKIAQALPGVPFSLDYAKPPPGRDIFLPLISICLTLCAFFAIPVLRRRLNPCLLPCLIALSPLAFGAAPGFALAALLAGFASLLVDSGQKAQMRELPRPFTPRWLLAAAMIVCYGFFSFFSGIPVLFVSLVLASFCCLLLVSIRFGGAGGAINGAIHGGKGSMTFNVSRWYPKRRRFNPVEIISRRTISASFFPVMLPFAVMAIALTFSGFANPRSSSPLPHEFNISPPPFTALPPGAITEADFREHYLFQSAFSLRALGQPYEAGGPPPVIAAYELSSGGLLAPVAPGVDEEPEIPDFPLGELLRGLNSASSRAVVIEDHGKPLGWLFAPLPFIFILPAIIYAMIFRKKETRGAAALSWGLGTGARRPLADHARESGLQRRAGKKGAGAIIGKR